MISLLLEIPKLMTGRIIRRSCHQFAWLLVVVVVLLSSSLICCLAPASASDTMAPVNNTAIEIFGYVPEYRFYINLNNTAPFLTDLIAFSVMPNADDDDDDDDDDAHVVLSCCLEKHHFEQIRQARASKTELNGGLSSPLRLWVTLGGAGRCEAFKSIASDSKRRKNLISSLIALCNKEELNGINLDCLTPVNQQEANDYLQFLAELSTAFQKQKQAGSSSSFQLSITLHPGQYLPTKAYEFVDRLLIMTYDMPSSSGHHASMDTVKRVIDGFLENQAPADKMVLGIPAYARDAENPGEVKTFSEIVDELKPSSLDDLEVKRWGNYPFDSPSVVQEKTAYAREKGLAGVFLWEIGQDKQHALGPGGLLLEASYRESIGTYTGKESLNEEL